MIDIIVLDDEWYNLEEICSLAEKTGFLRVVGRYMNPTAALEEAPSLQPRAALIDIELPEMDGLSFAEKLLSACPSATVAFITTWDRYAVKAFDLNALDYVMKPIKEERFAQLAEKIRRESEITTIPDTRRLLSFYEQQGGSLPSTPSVRLTERETQVLSLLAQGLTQKEIAETLYLSVSSVKKHLASIYHKMKVSNKISAVQKAHEMYLL